MEGRGGADGEHCWRHGVGCSWLGSVAVSSGVLDEKTGLITQDGKQLVKHMNSKYF